LTIECIAPLVLDYLGMLVPVKALAKIHNVSVYEAKAVLSDLPRNIRSEIEQRNKSFGIRSRRVRSADLDTLVRVLYRLGVSTTFIGKVLKISPMTAIRIVRSLPEDVKAAAKCLQPPRRNSTKAEIDAVWDKIRRVCFSDAFYPVFRVHAEVPPPPRVKFEIAFVDVPNLEHNLRKHGVAQRGAVFRLVRKRLAAGTHIWWFLQGPRKVLDGNPRTEKVFVQDLLKFGGNRTRPRYRDVDALLTGRACAAVEKYSPFISKVTLASGDADLAVVLEVAREHGMKTGVLAADADSAAVNLDFAEQVSYLVSK